VKVCTAKVLFSLVDSQMYPARTLEKKRRPKILSRIQSKISISKKAECMKNRFVHAGKSVSYIEKMINNFRKDV
jgi:hypothetical protein